MGCNYYLKYKVKNIDEYIKVTKILESQDSGYGKFEIKELKNGYIVNETYYKDLDEFEDEYIDLHIGKSSYGWHFNLCVYPDLGIRNLNDWINIFNNNEIVDEYERQVSVEDMLDTITNRQHDDKHLSEEAILKKINEVQKIIQCKPYASYDEYLKLNYAERGLNGLLAHRTREYIRTDGTYDLTNYWNFS